jgi:N-methylhydantoinase B
VKAIKPIFFDGRLVAFAVNLSHWPDVGGAQPGSYLPSATDLVQEGLHITPVRLFDANGPIRETFDLVLANLRNRVEREGDIFAQRAAAEVASRRLHEVFEQFGAPTVEACFIRIMDESEALMRAALSEVPDGVYEGEDFLDDDGIVDRAVRIVARVTIRGDTAELDFTGTDPQTRGPLNTTPFVAHSAVYYTFKALIGPDIPPNDGCYRPITVRIPPGSILDPSPDAPLVAGNHETSQRVVDALFRAFAAAVPDRVVAGGITTGGLVILTGRRPHGRLFTLYEVHGGGEGAGVWRDGLSAARVHTANTMNTPVEVLEHEYPLTIERYELRAGSGGAGRYRGGLGIRRTYRLLDVEARLTTVMERCRVRPWGLFGGEDGQASHITLERDGKRREIRGKETLDLQSGDLLIVETAGGGGYGSAKDRPIQLVERDRREGYA